MIKRIVAVSCLLLLTACQPARSRAEADKLGRDGYIECFKDAYGRNLCREIRIDRKTGDEDVYMQQSYY